MITRPRYLVFFYAIVLTVFLSNSGCQKEEPAKVDESQVINQNPDDQTTNPDDQTTTNPDDQTTPDPPEPVEMSCEDLVNISISGFEITKDDPAELGFHYKVTLTNSGTVTIDLSKFMVQNYLTTKDAQGNESNVGAGSHKVVSRLCDSDTIAEGESTTMEFKTSGRAGDGLTIFLLSKLKGCTEPANLMEYFEF